MSKWKALIAAGLIAALIAGGLVYTGAVSGADRADQDAAEAPEQDASAVVLTYNDIVDLRAYFDYKDLYETQLRYNETEEIMALDPFNSFMGYFTVCVSECDAEAIQNVLKAYEVGLIAEKGQYGPLLSYAFQVNNAFAENGNPQKASGLISVSIYAADEDVCRQRMDDVRSRLMERKQEISDTTAAHELGALAEMVSAAPEEYVIDLQKTYSTVLSTYFNNLKIGYGRLTKTARDFLTLYDTETTYATTETLDAYMNEMAAAEQNAEAVAEKPISPVKAAAVGFIAGAVLLLLVTILAYCFRNKLRMEDNISEITGIGLLGIASDETKRKKLFPDRNIESRLYRHTELLSGEEGMKLLALSIRARAAKAGAKEIYLTGSVMSEREKQIADTLAKELSGSGILLTAGQSILANAAAVEKAAEAKYVILTEKAGASTYYDIKSEKKKCAEQDVCLLGMVVAE